MLLTALPAPGALPPMEWASWDTRHLFFTGKGGVDKTTAASSIALALADAGKRALVISTDPACNLDDVFGIQAGPEPTPVHAVPDLFLARLDPEAAAEAFKERAVGPYRGAAVGDRAEPARTTLILVSRAETSAPREAARASAELAALGATKPPARDQRPPERP